MAYKRADRVNALLQRELGMLISEELRDPRISFPTVTSVEITDDLRSARVYVSVLGDDDAAKTTMAALEDAKPYLRHELGSRTDLRFVPELAFVPDRSAERAVRVARLLREAREGETKSSEGSASRPPSAAQSADEVVDLLRGARAIAIVSHRDPDPDTIGAGLALGLGLESLGKKISWHCADPIPESVRFLRGSERYGQEPPPGDVDLVVTVDFGSVERAKFALPSGPRLVNIDHHASNDEFGSANLVDATSAATAELVSRVIDTLGIAWTPDMATAALAGIMTDTGSFQFPSTDGRALERAARLREAGADLQAITYNIYRNKRFEALKLWGFAFSRLVRQDDGQLVWTELRAGDLESAGAREEDISGLVEQIARSSGMRVALLFNEQDGVVKVSCRTSQWEPSVDAAALMSTFGGGGHVRAAGALVPGELAAVRQLVLQTAQAALKSARARTAVGA